MRTIAWTGFFVAPLPTEELRPIAPEGRFSDAKAFADMIRSLSLVPQVLIAS